MSLQMVGGYTGASLIPPLIGIASGMLTMVVFAFVIPAVLILLIISTELMNKLLKAK